MLDEDSATVARRAPWNKGKLSGAKPPLRPNQVWSIRTLLLIGRRTRWFAYGQVVTMTEILRRCGGELTQENALNQPLIQPDSPRRSCSTV
jgi:hypothetical protein